MKTPKELAEEYAKEIEEVPIVFYKPIEHCRKAYLAGYAAGYDACKEIYEVLIKQMAKRGENDENT